MNDFTLIFPSGTRNNNTAEMLLFQLAPFDITGKPFINLDDMKDFGTSQILDAIKNHTIAMSKLV
jgi:hypothetical protein